MTVVDDAVESAPSPREGAPRGDDRSDVECRQPGQLPFADVWPGFTPKALAMAVGFFVVVLVLAIGAVIYWIGPLVHERDQRALIDAERTAIDNAAKDNEGLYRPTLPTLAPAPGSVVGILAIPVIGLQQAVVEGVGPAQTVSGPGPRAGHRRAWAAWQFRHRRVAVRATAAPSGNWVACSGGTGS